MDMKILCAVLIVAASMTATLAAKDVLAPAPAPAQAPAPEAAAASDSTATLPVAGSFVGASLLSFFALFFQ